ncbi:MAG: HD-GYP domain-containing protein [Bryobacterales bacterium]
MTSAVDARDVYTLGHSRRVSGYAVQLATQMGLPAEEIEILRVGGLLHDVGKIGVPDAVLRKPGRLTAEEMQLIQQHPVIGRHIVERVEGFSAYLPIIELHHENYDGSGYPCGQRGEETPLAARIVHVVDAYDAMTSDRPYRSGMTHEQATAIWRSARARSLTRRSCGSS